MIALIVAYTKNRVIGNKGQIPWRIKGEQKRFKELTTGNAVVMGRRSYEEIGRPLPNRMTYVVSNTKNFDQEGVKTVGSIDEAIRLAGDKDVYISGGAGIYREAMEMVDRMYITEIDVEIEGDTYFPEFDKKDFTYYVDKCVDGEIPYKYVTYTRIRYPRKCACCNEGIIEEKYGICDVCGWEDDKVQNADVHFAGGANRLSLIDHCREHFKDSRIKYYHIEQFDRTDLVRTVYTTVADSAWKYGKEGSFQNCIRLANTMGIKPDNMVMLNQTHSDGIRVITHEDGGEMVVRPMTADGCDGMITSEAGIMLCTVEADCVPVYILDPKHPAIGMVHSGWKGTASHIVVRAIEKMMKTYGSKANDILVAFGPCICGNCYEVGSELRDEFAANYHADEIEAIFKPAQDDKYMLDLKKAIRISLKWTGIRGENIFDTGRCTKESADLCSWRRDNPVMKSMLTGIMLH